MFNIHAWSTSRYIIRLDDACPTMKSELWLMLEEAFDSLDIHPIIGVIPDNRDEMLNLSEPDLHFWDKARCWQAKSWSLALHGLHHVYHEVQKNDRPFIGLHKKSEFVGLSLTEQVELLRGSYRIFIENEIYPKLFMAPSHSFDLNTLRALRETTDINIITDGYATSVFQYNDFIWLPQQLWRLRWMPYGIWTVCIHPNMMDEQSIENFIIDLKRFRNRIISVEDLDLKNIRSRRITDYIFASLYRLAIVARLQLFKL